MTLAALALTAIVKARALALGFDDVAVGPADPPEHGAAFERWLDAGHAGEMSYLERGRADRLDPGRLLAGCRSVVAVALAYGPREESPGWSGIARYARGRDYHDVMRPRLAALVAALREAGGPDVRSRAAVDTSAVLERDLAARAGLGWIGKNTNLLHPSRGSYVFLGIVLTTAELTFDVPAPDRCGSCTACLDACPTEAFVAPYVLDARRCIAYLTIEHRGDIDARWRGRLGGWLFGCDVCQEVCPWNRKAPPAREPALAPVGPPPAAEEVLGMDEATFRERFRDSPLKRARRSGLARNAALVLSRRTEPATLAALRRACTDGDPVVATAARWAVEQERGAR
jgi:epoxyqueuosine reductase